MAPVLRCVTMVIISVVYVLAASSLDKQRADELHRKAMEIVRQGDYQHGLAHFRAACRRYNSSALFWNDLGVTEMRMGQLERAAKRFAKAITIDPNFATAAKNLEELRAYMPNDKHDINMHIDRTYVQEHTVQCPKEVSHSCFALEAFHILETEGVCGSIFNKPFIVKGAFKLFNITNENTERVFNRKFLSEKYGTQRVDFYPHNMNEEQAHPYFLSLEPALRQLLYGPEETYVGVDASEPGTYVQWNLDAQMWRELLLQELGGTIPTVLDDSRWTQTCFAGRDKQTDTIENVEASGDTTVNVFTNIASQDRSGVDVASLSRFFLSTHWQMLLLGEQGAGMFIHQDTLRSASWQLQIVGSKKWHLCGPEQSPYLYKAGEVDMLNPDYVRFPLLKKASCYEVTVNAGELLYYPADYWHQTENLETPSIALSSTLVTALNHNLVAEELRKECSGAGRIFAPQPRMCEYLERCYALWEDMYA